MRWLMLADFAASAVAQATCKDDFCCDMVLYLQKIWDLSK